MHRPVMGKFEREWNRIFSKAELTPSEEIWHAIDSKLWLNENYGFENGWRNRFQDAELEPSKEVWRSIDTELVYSENNRMKMRSTTYQRIAAASVGLLVFIGSYYWVSNSTVNNTQLSNTPISTTEPGNATEGQKNVESNLAKEEPSNNSNQDLASNPGAIDSRLPESEGSNNPTRAVTHQGSSLNSNTEDLATTGINDSKYQNANAVDLSSDLIAKKHSANFSQGPISKLTLVNVDKLPHFFSPNDYVIAYRIADAMPVVRSKKKLDAIDNKWAAISFSAGTFSQGIGNTAILESDRAVQASLADLKANSASTTRSENVRPGTSITMALSAGKRIFKKFILQGGMSYLKQASASSAEVVAVAPANQVYTLAAVSPESMNTVTYPSKQEINSTFQFLSVPVQLGYMLVDRKFGIQLNGGVSPDFFLGNSVYNETTQVETINSAGEDGTFNRVSLAGLGSIEFSYRFLNHYRLSLAPGVRYSLTSIYNENTSASAKPFVADIGLRFRYIF